MYISSLPGEDEPNEKIPIYLEENVLLAEFLIFYRPYLLDFLMDVSEKYEIILYSSLKSVFIKKILEKIENQKKFFEYCLGEEYCLFTNVTYGIKCIDIFLTNRKKEDIVFVDTTVKSLPFDSDNLIPISSYFTENQSDVELLNLAALLDEIYKAKDIRETIQKYRSA